MSDVSTSSPSNALNTLLQAQKRAHLAAGPLPASTRREWLERLIGLLVDHKDEIAQTISRDFGNRTRELSLLADVVGSINELKFARDHLEEWMQPEAHAGLFPDAQARVDFVPLGTVGLLSPWNFPVNLTFAPLAGIIAAGNRCMIKPSELTPATSALIARMIRSQFAETEISVTLGGPDIAAAFSGLAFDHLLYTGSTSVGRQVMREAASHLVPVTLELGGKSPVIISNSAPIEDAAARVMTIKTLNAGQICLAPDYVLLPRAKLEEFCNAAVAATTRIFPSLAGNPDYTAIINARHFARLQSYLKDAQERGAQLIEINPSGARLDAQNISYMAPTLVVEPPPEAKIMQEEIFGPLLPILTYDTIDEAIEFVNNRDRPLALYYFGQDSVEEQRVIRHTNSGGVTVNDVMTHAFSDTLPFGGIGPSGMGAYHGKAGFLTFSHARAIYRQSKAVEAEYALRGPFGAATHAYIDAAATR